MSEHIDEFVSVNLLSNHLKHTANPSSLYWRGRRYTLTKIGLHHTTRDGRTLIHIFSATDGVTYFKLQFDTENLLWRLLEVESIH
jgi:hypothetical protein